MVKIRWGNLNNLIDSLLKVFDRDLNKLKDEINLFINDKDLWLTPGEIKNSPGNVSLHICGNLKHFIGAILGNSGYIRERDKEFSLKNISKEELLLNVEETKNIVKETLSSLDSALLTKKYPLNVFGEEMSTEYFLIHLSTHLNYHLGQINYLRRILVN